MENKHIFGIYDKVWYGGADRWFPSWALSVCVAVFLSWKQKRRNRPSCNITLWHLLDIITENSSVSLSMLGSYINLLTWSKSIVLYLSWNVHEVIRWISSSTSPLSQYMHIRFWKSGFGLRYLSVSVRKLWELSLNLAIAFLRSMLCIPNK